MTTVTPQQIATYLVYAALKPLFRQKLLHGIKHFAQRHDPTFTSKKRAYLSRQLSNRRYFRKGNGVPFAILLSLHAYAQSGDPMLEAFPNERMEACQTLARQKECDTPLSNLSVATTYIQGQIIACKQEYQANQCQDLEANPDNKGKLIQCNEKGLCQTYGDGLGKCLKDNLQMSEEAITGLLNSIMNLPSAVAATPQAIRNMADEMAQAIWKSYSAQRTCNENKSGEKRAMIEAFNKQLDSSLKTRWQVSDSLAEGYLELTCTQITQRLQERLKDHNREYIGRIQSGALKVSTQVLQNQIDLWNLLKKIALDMKRKAQCYNSLTKSEMLCNGALVIASLALSPIVSAGVARAISALASRGILTAPQAEWLTLLAGADSQLQHDDKLLQLVGSHKESFGELTSSLTEGSMPTPRKMNDRVAELASRARLIRKEVPELANFRREDEGPIISLIDQLKSRGVSLDKIRNEIRASMTLEGGLCPAQ